MEKIDNWNDLKERAWKKQIREIVDEMLNRYDGSSSIFLHWDPPMEGDQRFEQKYRCEYFEKVYTGLSFDGLEKMGEDAIFIKYRNDIMRVAGFQRRDS